MLTVYLSNRQIQIVQGKGGKRSAIQDVLTFDAPEGSLINGVITDDDGLCAALREFWKAHSLPRKNVQLVINSTQLNFRVIVAPKQSRKASAEFLGREFTDAEQVDDPVFGWWTLSEDKEKKTCRLAATMGQRTYLCGLVEFFQNAGIALCGICTAQDAALAALDVMPQGQETCIFQIADGSSLLHILVVDGRYVYSNTNRLYSAPGSPEYGTEAGRCISNILQFVRAQRIEAAIGTVYIAGMLPEDEQRCADVIGGFASSMQVRRLVCTDGIRMERTLQKAFGSFIYAAGGLLRAGTNTDLLHMLGRNAEQQKQGRDAMRRIVPCAVTGGILLAVCIGFGIQNILLKSRLAVLNGYLASENVQSQCAEYDALTTENAVLQESLREIEDDLAAIQSYPYANSKLERVLQSCTSGFDVTVSFSSFDAATGQLNLSTTAADVETINQYISVLRSETVFQSVDYTGYSYNDSTGNWTVNVSCILSEEAGK